MKTTQRITTIALALVFACALFATAPHAVSLVDDTGIHCIGDASCTTAVGGLSTSSGTVTIPRPPPTTGDGPDDGTGSYGRPNLALGDGDRGYGQRPTVGTGCVACQGSGSFGHGNVEGGGGGR